MWDGQVAFSVELLYNPRMEFNQEWFEEQLLDRFLRYVRIHTTSDRDAQVVPSTPRQWDLINLLVDELKSIGIDDIDLTDEGYIIARIPASNGRDGAPVVGFMAHVDTVQDVPGDNVNPQVHREYDGSIIEIGEGVVIDPAKNDALKARIGDTIITTDGTTLLGADDKAGIAEIMTAAEWLTQNEDFAHGGVELVFTPDEETGHGMDHFPADKLQSVAAYTLDGDVEGTIEMECFSAEKVAVEFTGVSTHPGTARGKLVNAVTMAASFVAMLPRNESPEATDHRYGFYLPLEIEGTPENAKVSILLRDFEQDEIERRRKALSSIAQAVEAQFPGGKVTTEAQQQYTNMKKYLDSSPEVARLLEEAVRATGIDPVTKIIRGGTDGARLSAMGIPTPNIFTGGNSYHSRGEWAALGVMARATQVILHLISLWGEQGK